MYVKYTILKCVYSDYFTCPTHIDIHPIILEQNGRKSEIGIAKKYLGDEENDKAK